MKRIVQKWALFRKDVSGNIMLLFALTVGPLLAAAGAALDYSTASNTRAALVSLADTAALAGAKTIGTPAQREAAARSVFESNLARTAYAGLVQPTYTNIMEDGVSVAYRVDVDSVVRLKMGRFVGMNEASIKASAVADTPSLDGIEIAFVLDTTASMQGARITSLKSAVNGVLDEIQTRSGRNGNIKVGVVPFSQYVNIGTGYRNEPWLDVPADYQTAVRRNCRMERIQVGETNCRMVHTPAQPAVPPRTCIEDGVPRSCGGRAAQPARNDRVCDPVYDGQREVCTNSGGNWVRWNGCVGSRAHPLNTMDGGYATRIPGMMGITCGTPILPLTTNISAARSTVNALNTTGETYIPSGLIWGWRMLSPQAPLIATTPSAAEPAKKYMILVTDGRNTKSPNYPDHNGNNGQLADQLTAEICNRLPTDRINAIKVFTIAFEMDGLDGKQILQQCSARTGGQFFDATNATRLREAFSQILDAITTVKLTQ